MTLVRLYILSFSLLLMAGCQSGPEVVKMSGRTMGTQYNISWVESEAHSRQSSEQLQQKVENVLERINASMSTYRPDSELSVLNKQAPGDWQDISIDLYRVLMMSGSVYLGSDHAFDPTVGPLVNLWGFGPEKKADQVPDALAIKQAMTSVGYGVANLRLRDEGYQVQLRDSRYIDLSAIAKGYAVDELGRLFDGVRINNYLIEVGGELLAKGRKPDGSAWRIAIEAPPESGRRVQKIVALNDFGIATSGDYRNYFEQDGKRFSHTIDPRTGYPIEHKLASVSVLHESVALADAWATALMVLGTEKGMAVAQKFDLMVYFLYRTEQGFADAASPAFDKFLQAGK